MSQVRRVLSALGSFKHHTSFPSISLSTHHLPVQSGPERPEIMTYLVCSYQAVANQCYWLTTVRRLACCCLGIEFLSLPRVALPFIQFALHHSIPRVHLSLITTLGNCGCIYLGMLPPPPLGAEVVRAYPSTCWEFYTVCTLCLPSHTNIICANRCLS
jgi:hypothetical protein